MNENQKAIFEMRLYMQRLLAGRAVEVLNAWFNRASSPEPDTEFRLYKVAGVLRDWQDIALDSSAPQSNLATSGHIDNLLVWVGLAIEDAKAQLNRLMEVQALLERLRKTLK